MTPVDSASGSGSRNKWLFIGGGGIVAVIVVVVAFLIMGGDPESTGVMPSPAGPRATSAPMAAPTTSVPTAVPATSAPAAALRHVRTGGPCACTTAHIRRCHHIL